MLEHAEFIEKCLPWKKVEDTSFAVSTLKALGDFTDELVIADFPVKQTDIEGMVIVAPRYFRGQALEEEFEAFLDFTSMLSQNIEAFGLPIQLLPMHPRSEDLALRAPHPSVLLLRDNTA